MRRQVVSSESSPSRLYRAQRDQAPDGRAHRLLGAFRQSLLEVRPQAEVATAAGPASPCSSLRTTRADNKGLHVPKPSLATCQPIAVVPNAIVPVSSEIG